MYSLIWSCNLSCGRHIREGCQSRQRPQLDGYIFVIGIVASIGLDFFTGGLQHFPDSPLRSSWVVPVGFAMSLLAMYLMEAKGMVKVKSVLIYGAISLTAVIAAPLYALAYFNEHGSGDHGPSHDHAASPQSWRHP